MKISPDYNVVGKIVRVDVEIPSIGKFENKNTKNVTGRCTWFGYNKVLETWQITVDRLPIYVEDLNKIKVIDDENKPNA